MAVINDAMEGGIIGSNSSLFPGSLTFLPFDCSRSILEENLVGYIFLVLLFLAYLYDLLWAMGYGEGTDSVMNLKVTPLFFYLLVLCYCQKKLLWDFAASSVWASMKHTYTESAAKIQGQQNYVA